MISGGLAGLAGTSDVLATKGLFQADWYPDYGLAAFALVFLARLQPFMLLPVGLLFGVFALGADLLRSDDVPNYFIPLLEGLILISLAATVRLERLKGIAKIGSAWTGRSVAAGSDS
jgi:simple sugar transport system permease protein